MKKDLQYFDCTIKDMKFGYHSYMNTVFCSITFDAPEFRDYYMDRQLDLYLSNPFDAKILEILYERVFGCPTFTYRPAEHIIGTKVTIGVKDLDHFNVREINGVNFDDLVAANPKLVSLANQARNSFAEEFKIPKDMDIKFAELDDSNEI